MANAKDIKTLALRLDADQHARLSIIAELAQVSITDLVKGAIDERIEKLAGDPQIVARADAAAQGIRDAAHAREAAIQDMFGTTASKSVPAKTTARSPKSSS